MIEPTLDQKAAAKLGMLPEQVGVFRGEWEKMPMAAVVKCLWTVKLESMLTERLTKLRSCEPEALRKLQGEIQGLQLALDVVNGRLA